MVPTASIVVAIQCRNPKSCSCQPMNKWQRGCQRPRQIDRARTPKVLSPRDVRRTQAASRSLRMSCSARSARQAAALQIAAQSHDDGVKHEAINDDRTQGRCESHEQGTKYRDLARHHLAPCCAARTITARGPSTRSRQQAPILKPAANHRPTAFST
jgi:hypothetical protein